MAKGGKQQHPPEFSVRRALEEGGPGALSSVSLPGKYQECDGFLSREGERLGVETLTIQRGSVRQEAELLREDSCERRFPHASGSRQQNLARSVSRPLARCLQPALDLFDPLVHPAHVVPGPFGGLDVGAHGVSVGERNGEGDSVKIHLPTREYRSFPPSAFGTAGSRLFPEEEGVPFRRVSQNGGGVRTMKVVWRPR